MIMQKKKSL